MDRVGLGTGKKVALIAAFALAKSASTQGITCPGQTCSGLDYWVHPGEKVEMDNSNFTSILNPQESSGESENPTARFGITFQIPVINHYGCWCYGGQFWPGARDQLGAGPAQDQWDEICKAHHQGFDCIKMDGEDKNEVCDPSTTDYKLLISGLFTGDYLVECHDDNKLNWCKYATCLVDLQFIKANWDLEEQGIPKDYANLGHPGYHNNEGNFDTAVCPTKFHGGGGGPGNVNRPDPHKTCCGDYPYRLWYMTRNQKNIQCCEVDDPVVNNDFGEPIKVGTLYNSLAGTCCSHGVVYGSTVC